LPIKNLARGGASNHQREDVTSGLQWWLRVLTQRDGLKVLKRCHQGFVGLSDRCAQGVDHSIFTANGSLSNFDGRVLLPRFLILIVTFILSPVIIE